MKLYPSFTPDLAAWVSRQPIFFTGTAPSSRGGRVNVSPKGLATSHFAVLSPTRCAYIDRTGSGCETIAHAYDNGRLTLLFNSFGPSPRILRVFGRASVVEHDDVEFEALARQIVEAAGGGGGGGGEEEEEEEEGMAAVVEWPGSFDGARAIIVCDVYEVQTSCGYAVPMVRRRRRRRHLSQEGADGADGDDGDYEEYDERTAFEDRQTLCEFARKEEARGRTLPYRAQKNTASLDGLPGLRSARRDAGETLWLTDARAWFWRALEGRGGFAMGVVVGMVVMAVAMLGGRLVVDGLPMEGL